MIIQPYWSVLATNGRLEDKTKSGCLEQTGGETTLQERERDTTGKWRGERHHGEWRCAQGGGGLSEQGLPGEGVHVIKRQGKAHRRMNQHGEVRWGRGIRETRNRRINVGIVGVTDLQSGEDGREVNITYVMDGKST